jgi:hypothetical protein
MIGRLKHTLKERCPECGKVLQVRVLDIVTLIDGIRVTTPKEHISCSNKNCEYEREVEQKRRRRKEEEI